MKKHKVIPLESMEIEFLDKTLVFTFDMQAIAKIQNEYGALEKIAKEHGEFEMTAILLWGGVKDAEFTIDEAKVIISSSAEVLSDTLTVTYESIERMGGEEVSKKLKEEIAQLQVRA